MSIHADGSLVNDLIILVGQHKESEYILQEATAAIKNYLRRVLYINHIKHKNISTLINTTLTCKFPRSRQNLVMILKACTDVPDFKKYIKELGGNNLIEDAPSGNL